MASNQIHEVLNFSEFKLSPLPPYRLSRHLIKIKITKNTVFSNSVGPHSTHPLRTADYNLCIPEISHEQLGFCKNQIHIGSILDSTDLFRLGSLVASESPSSASPRYISLITATWKNLAIPSSRNRPIRQSTQNSIRIVTTMMSSDAEMKKMMVGWKQGNGDHGGNDKPCCRTARCCWRRWKTMSSRWFFIRVAKC